MFKRPPWKVLRVTFITQMTLSNWARCRIIELYHLVFQKGEGVDQDAEASQVKRHRRDSVRQIRAPRPGQWSPWPSLSTAITPRPELRAAGRVSPDFPCQVLTRPGSQPPPTALFSALLELVAAKLQLSWPSRRFLCLTHVHLANPVSASGEKLQSHLL